LRPHPAFPRLLFTPTLAVLLLEQHQRDASDAREVLGGVADARIAN
jgi:hypothetical protein